MKKININLDISKLSAVEKKEMDTIKKDTF